jgi:CheY-like chemotaxis protein
MQQVELSSDFLTRFDEEVEFTIREITDPKKSDEKLRSALDTLRAVIDASPSAVIALTLDARVSDLLVTDMVMPGTRGVELANRLLKTRQCLKILYISGYPPDGIGTRGVPDPKMDYLPKPFTPAELARKVRNVLGARTSAGKADPSSRCTAHGHRPAQNLSYAGQPVPGIFGRAPHAFPGRSRARCRDRRKT